MRKLGESATAGDVVTWVEDGYLAVIQSSLSSGGLEGSGLSEAVCRFGALIDSLTVRADGLDVIRGLQLAREQEMAKNEGADIILGQIKSLADLAIGEGGNQQLAS